MSLRKLVSSLLVPDDIKQDFMCLEQAQTPEGELWRGIALRVVLDACGQTGANVDEEHNQLVREARNWLKFNHKHVDLVFTLADINPEKMREKLLAIPPRYVDEEG